MAKEAFSIDMLAQDWREATYLGRIQTPEGPSPILIAGGVITDMSKVAPTVAQLVQDRAFDPSSGVAIGEIESFDWSGDVRLLSPIDLQCIKAAGVTFAVSAIERVIEERARGDSARAAEIREMLEDKVGSGIRSVRPGSVAAADLKQALLDEGMWSQYLEVAIGPDAEIFTKAPVLSSVGWGQEVGVRSDSNWNNPEPELAILADRKGQAIGACLANDVNLRDFEGRSALLLGKAKDNTASCALGPLIRLFDEKFTLDDARTAEIELLVEGNEGYELRGSSSMAEISRDPETLLQQAMSEHCYPDGFILLLGTMFAPTQDRDQPGLGFTHKLGDRVSISTPRIGRLSNRVTHSKLAEPWAFGIGDLMQNLASRGLLRGA